MTAPTASLADSYAALSGGAVGFVGRCDLVTVRGPDARSYLQGQCTQEVADLHPGEARFSLVLSVQGKVEALCRVGALDEETFVLDTEAGQGEALVERLRRFKIRVKAELSMDTVPLVCVRGPLAPPPPDAGEGRLVRVPLSGRAAGYDLIGAGAEVPEGVVVGDAEALELARIVAGEPRMGRELDESTIPFEAGIVEATTSFTKGCYTGQELIARLEARGANVPRRLRALRGGPEVPLAVLAPGASVILGDAVVGRVTSSAALPGGAGAVALAYLQRKVVPPTTATVRLDEEVGGVSVEVDELPGRLGPSATAR
ncbi:MAG: hypothetical protein M0004_09240 [Actinomycetota bacterium]|nr:hypothetical protein [Actinomycetota bacterium]